MKIGLLLPGFSSSEEDRCIPALSKLVWELARQHEIHVFTLRYPFRRSVYSIFGATVHGFGGAGATGFARLPLLARAFGSIRNEHQRQPFDVLHGLWADEPGFLAVVAGRFLKVPSVVTLLGGELVGFPDIGYGSQLSRMNRRMVRRALGRAHAVTVGSSYLRRLAEPHVTSERLRFLPIGVDTSLFNPDQSSLHLEGRFKLLHVASLVAVKDQAVLLRAMSRIRIADSGAHLHIVGAGPLRKELEASARSLGVDAHLTFHGPVPHDRLPHYYRSADLCVMASRHEGQEWVTQEAAACGRSTVGTAVGVVPDLEPATRAVPVADDVALAKTVVGLACRPLAAQAMGRAALDLIGKGYTLSLTVESLNVLYGDLIRTAFRTRSVSEVSETPARP